MVVLIGGRKLSMKIIKISRGYEVFVDNEDFEYLKNIKWYGLPQKNTTYAAGYVNGKMKRIHRYIMGFYNPNLIDGLSIDHIDGNGLNNQKSNLRICTTAQNRWNSKPTEKPNRTSKFKGVSYVGRETVWRAFTYIGRKQVYLGRFKTEIEAAEAYNKKALELFGEYARLNILEKA